MMKYLKFAQEDDENLSPKVRKITTPTSPRSISRLEAHHAYFASNTTLPSLRSHFPPKKVPRFLHLENAMLSPFSPTAESNSIHKDALLRWVNLNTANHKDAQATNFTKDFHSGMVLCALIHKFRPDLINYDSLSPSEGQANLKTAMDAAQTCVGLELGGACLCPIRATPPHSRR
jgi:hypothetical protein